MSGREVMHRLGIGDTSLIDLPDFARPSTVQLKAEFENPSGSVKDRTAAYLAAWAQAEGGPHVRIVESTSGNLGISLSYICTLLGMQPPLLIIDSSIPAEKAAAIDHCGAETLVVRKARVGLTLRETRVQIADEVGRQAGYLWVNQYGNNANFLAHTETTGPELTSAPGGIMMVIAPISTGGTACGIAGHLASHPGSRVVAVEPLGSTIFGGRDDSFVTAGAGFHGAPAIVQRNGGLLGGYAQVPDEISARECVLLRDQYGLSVGLTTGAALACARAIGSAEAHRVVVIAADGGDHYTAEIAALSSSPSYPDSQRAMRIQVN
ncbi:MAG: pyridoxal-phosphate dependent enzyme [Acidimicrobiales bacterium]